MIAIKLTAQHRRLRRKYTKQIYRPGWGSGVYLTVDRQSFMVLLDASDEQPSRRRAAWYRDNLAIALARLVEKESK